MHSYWHSGKAAEYAIALQDSTDLELAEAYEQYMDSPGSMYFSEIFWEANRRAVADDLEQILIEDRS